MISFQDKNVLITGGGQGIGRTIAMAYARKGATVLINDINEQQAEASRHEIESMGGNAHSFVADITDVDALIQMRERIRREVGPVDVLVNNAGVVFGGSFLDVPLERHRLTYEVNVIGLTNVTWIFLPELLKRPEARIVNIASASSLVGLPYGSSYSASKWAALGLSESLRLELKEKGRKDIRVTAICPSFINTGMFDGVRPPRLTRMLEPDALADKIVMASARGDAVLMEPFMVKMMPLLQLLPRRMLDALGRILGVTTSMRQWRGHH